MNFGKPLRIWGVQRGLEEVMSESGEARVMDDDFMENFPLRITPFPCLAGSQRGAVSKAAGSLGEQHREGVHH